MIRDRQSALDFLLGRIDYERTRSVPYRSRRFKLDRMRQLVALLGHPESDFPAIHVAGTKGKGSTASMIATALTAAGLRTGLYTSPHLHRLEERFVVDRQECSELELVSLMADLRDAVDRLDRMASANGDCLGPTYFEITTAAALLHFRRKKVDCAVLEVGMGGRLDSTNICHPVVSVITTISLDHTRQLGETRPEIAAEKAGIIKPGIPVVTGVREPEPFEVIASIAAQNNSPVLAIGRDFDFEHSVMHNAPTAAGEPIGSNVIDYHEQIDGVSRSWNDVDVAMLGRHQGGNAAVALATLGQLQRMGWNIAEAALRAGMGQTCCPARFEVVGHSPAVVLDAAHNPASVAALSKTLDDQFPTRPRLLVFATSVDKDVPKMLAQLLPRFEHVVLTRYLNNPRAADPTEIEQQARSMARQQGWSDLRLDVCPDPHTAWRRVRALATPRHVICVTGSFFLAAEMREHLEAQGLAASDDRSFLR